MWLELKPRVSRGCACALRWLNVAKNNGAILIVRRNGRGAISREKGDGRQHGREHSLYWKSFGNSEGERNEPEFT